MDERRQLDMPDRRKTPYDSISKKLDDHIAEIEERLRRFFTKALVAFAVLGITSAIGLFGFAFVLDEIQEQRYVSILDTCNDTNARHDNVIAQIDTAVASVPEGRRRELAEERAEPFKLIITAAVPKTEDCEAFAKDRVGK